MNPVTHQMQQTIYMATYNDQPEAKDDIFKILTQAAAEGSRGSGSAGGVQARGVRRDADVRDVTDRAARSVTLVPHLVNGVALGLLFALIALGFMLIVGVMETINLAHGSFFALGMYVALTLIAPQPRVAPASFGVDRRCRWAGATRSRSSLAPLLVGVAGMLLELAMRRTYGRDALYGLLLTFGAALVIEEADPRACWARRRNSCRCRRRSPARSWSATSSTPSTGCSPAPSRSSRSLALWLFLESTPYGAMIKAGAHDSEMVRALGVDLARLRLFVFALGVALAALAGVVMAPIWGMRPHVGVDAVVPAFLIIVLGGVGCFWGAVIAGAAGRTRRRRDGRVRVGVVAAVDVPAVHRRGDVPRARLVRQKSVLDV